MGESDTILLTGATGLLGNEILRVLLESSQCGSILVLIRAGRRDPQARFDALIGNSLRGEFARRVEPVWADLEQDRLGLTPTAYEQLAARVTHIIHSAAAVDFALPYDAVRPYSTWESAGSSVVQLIVAVFAATPDVDTPVTTGGVVSSLIE